MPRPTRHSLALLAAAAMCAALPASAQTCMAKSTAQAARVVELYTSEGCNSCPPADHWLSGLKLSADPGAVALAFHVDYWDSLGWADRFASPAFTRRQSQQHAVNGARYSYTPQVVVNGMDRKDWPAMRTAPAAAASPVRIELKRSGEQFMASVESATATRLAAYWAVTEDGHSSAVKAGENSGTTLKHDHVVRELLPVAAWAAVPSVASTLQFTPGTRFDPSHPRQVNLVVINADTGRPVQALKLGC